jgi:hypothetical protein
MRNRCHRNLFIELLPRNECLSTYCIVGCCTRSIFQGLCQAMPLIRRFDVLPSNATVTSGFWIVYPNLFDNRQAELQLIMALSILL